MRLLERFCSEELINEREVRGGDSGIVTDGDREEEGNGVKEKEAPGGGARDDEDGGMRT